MNALTARLERHGGGRAWRSGRHNARRAADSSAMEVAARWGFAACGVIYLLIGALALRIAYDGGHGGQQADRGGALAELAGNPVGKVLLWAVGIGLAGMALWRLSEAVVGAAQHDGRKARVRLMSAGRCVFYGFAAYSVLAFALGDRGSGSGSSDHQSRDATARLMGMTGGRWLVALAGVAVVVIGVCMGVLAARRRFHKQLKLGEMSRPARRYIDVTGVAGGVARGLIVAAAGGFALEAAITFDPDRAKGFDDTLRSFAGAPAGAWLLGGVALGLALFGLYCFGMARWHRVS
ncbi:DUF1206 domain-containing protein [Streptomyces fuscigenes]|uniref:DUF1206 domain-containing protein n=1 Tax=Streptomyces fuscigenes TaxID=1528880 RepID=UPI001F37B4EB|nr:DUF1206 domain-containing protein [Streptomyces fuscigenes]MCF3960880.1 DUF1206 domain-containing protein [Streptomyces fuscigenes]